MKKCKKHNIECAYNIFTFLGYKCCIAKSGIECVNGRFPMCLDYGVCCPHAWNAADYTCKIKDNCACEFIKNKYNTFMSNRKLPIEEPKSKIDSSFFGMDV